MHMFAFSDDWSALVASLESACQGAQTIKKFAQDNWMPSQTEDEIDLLLVSYVTYFSFLGCGISSAESVLPSWASCHPRWNRQGCKETPRLHRALKGFRRLAPPRSRVGVAWPATAGITAVLLRRQCYDEAAHRRICNPMKVWDSARFVSYRRKSLRHLTGL